MNEEDANEGLLKAARNMLKVLDALGEPLDMLEIGEFCRQVLAARAILKSAVAAKTHLVEKK